MKGARRRKQAFVKARQCDSLPTGAEKFNRCQMQGVERPDGDRKRLQGASEDRRSQLDQRHMADQRSYLLAMRAPQAPRVNTVPDLIFKEATRNQGLSPDGFGRRP